MRVAIFLLQGLLGRGVPVNEVIDAVSAKPYGFLSPSTGLRKHLRGELGPVADTGLVEHLGHMVLDRAR